MKFENQKKTKKIIQDMAINLVGTGISLVVLQLIVYPLVAKLIDSDTYGQMQSTISLIYLVGGTLGGSLSTTRLLREYAYKERQTVADFNLLNVGNLVFLLIASPIIFTVYLNKADGLSIFLITLIMVLHCSGNYFCVGFRLDLNYKAIFIQKIVNCVGYFLGFFVFYFVRRWEAIFVTSFFLDTAYCILYTQLIREPYKKSDLMMQTVKDYVSLSAARFTSSALTYFDKLFLYPLLGGEAVSIYFAANILGKLILMTIEPITNVVLSYLSKVKTVSGKIWGMVIPAALGLCALMYIVCLVISEPILNLLYPQWAAMSIRLIPVSTLSLVVSAFINIIYPFTLKSLPSYNQVIFNASGVLAYILSVMLLYKPYGLMGCCIALLISYIIKLISILILAMWRHYGK